MAVLLNALWCVDVIVLMTGFDGGALAIARDRQEGSGNIGVGTFFFRQDSDVVLSRAVHRREVVLSRAKT